MSFWQMAPLIVVAFIFIVLVAYVVESALARLFGHDMDQAWDEAWREFAEELEKKKDDPKWAEYFNELKRGKGDD